MNDFVLQVHRRWNTDDPYLLAAYVLWRLVWIHPFEDANGRTARALAYLVICLKQGAWLPGEVTMLSLIKDKADEYLAAIRHADHTEKQGGVDLLPLALFLARIAKIQVQLAAKPK